METLATKIVSIVLFPILIYGNKKQNKKQSA